MQFWLILSRLPKRPKWVDIYGASQMSCSTVRGECCLVAIVIAHRGAWISTSSIIP